MVARKSTTTEAEVEKTDATAPEAETTEATESSPVVEAAAATDDEQSTSTALPDETTLDSDNTAPSTTAPGDGPADTTDPRELASSAPFYPGPDAVAAGTVNAVQKVGMIPDLSADRDGSNDRTEKYETTGPKGERLQVTHNLETGATSVAPVADAE